MEFVDVQYVDLVTTILLRMLNRKETAQGDEEAMFTIADLLSGKVIAASDVPVPF